MFFSRSLTCTVPDLYFPSFFFSPDNTKIATISKDRRALVWDVKKGKKHAEMGWEPSGPYPKGQRVKYCFKRVRFAKVEGDPKKYRVFTIANPVGGGSRPPPSFLQVCFGNFFEGVCRVLFK